MRGPMLASFVLPLLVAGLAAQDSWTLSQAKSPPGRNATALAYDSARQVVVLFGGGGTLNDTWEWDGKTWTERKPKTVPRARGRHALAYDSFRKVTVMFGDATRTGTWEWDGKDWVRAGSVRSGDTRNDCAMAYDPIRRVVVRFGGERGKPQGGTHVWDGKTWSLASSGGPPVRYHGEMVWDSLRERIVLFGGLTTGGGRLNDTWEWDGKTWTERRPKTTTPAGDYGHSLAYHAGIGRVVKYGGVERATEGTTWSWDGIDWYKHSPKGNAGTVGFQSMAYDAKRNQIVLLSSPRTIPNPSPVYLYDAPLKTPAAVRVFGTGCAGKSGTPALKFGLLPYIGAPTTLEMTSLPKSTFAIPFLFIGSSNTNWGSNKLPFDLGNAGAAGCKLYVSPDLLLTLTNTGGSANLRAKVPLNTNLVGATAFAQGFVADGTANALGAAISNAVEGKIGQRW